MPRFVESLRDGIRSLAALLARQPVRISLIVVITTAITTAILGLGLIPAGYDFSEGDIAAADIHAPRTVLDPVETERRQVTAEQAAVERARENLEYYTIDPYASSDAVSDLQYIIARVAEVRQGLFYESVVVDQVPLAQGPR